MTEKTVSQSVIYIALECVLLTEGITPGSVGMSLCLFVVMAGVILLPEKRNWGKTLRIAADAACFLSAALYLRTTIRFLLIPEFLLACVILWLSERLLKTYDVLHAVQDTGREQEMRLREQNRKLLKEQEYEIRFATLSERNRIAREIHDNVGHMLSRALILLGAIQTVNKDAALSPPLDLLDQTLDTAMREMRSSVHDLHDDSIDFQKNIEDMVKELLSSGRCEVITDIDTDLNPEKTIKIALLAIAREAVSNYLKHSNGNKVKITVHDHPGFCTLSVSDNGMLTPETAARIQRGHGIDRGNGLANIRERAESLGGAAAFYTEHGVTVFVNLPKSRQ